MEAVGVLMLWVAGGLFLHLALGYLLHRVLFHEPAIELSTYFKAGDVFASDVEKLRQTVITSQFYRFLDADVRNGRPTGVLLQLALSIQHMDTWVAEGLRRRSRGRCSYSSHRLHVPWAIDHSTNNTASENIARARRWTMLKRP